MAYIKYTIHPDDPDKTFYERNKAYGLAFWGYISGLGSIGSVIYYICAVVKLYKTVVFEHALYSAGLVCLVSVIDFFLLFREWDNKREIAKKYYLFLFSGMLTLAGVIGMIMGINFLCHRGQGLSLLIISSLGVVIVLVLTRIIFLKIKGVKIKRVRLFTDHTNIKTQLPMMYCHKCGKQLPGDSAFCSSCGAKLK